jgi:hypothetical protein
MASLYTKKGKPLQVVGDDVFAKSGKQIGRIMGGRVYGPNGRYVGTIDGDRLVYRSPERGTVVGSFLPTRIAGSAEASTAGSAVWGEEPEIED